MLYEKVSDIGLDQLSDDEVCSGRCTDYPELCSRKGDQMIFEILKNMKLNYLSDDIVSSDQMERATAITSTPSGFDVELTYTWHKHSKMVSIECLEDVELVDITIEEVLRWVNKILKTLRLVNFSIDPDLMTLSFEAWFYLPENGSATEDQLMAYTTDVMYAVEFARDEFVGAY